MLRWIFRIYPVQSSVVYMCCDATHVVRRGCSRSYLACCTCISAWQKCPIEPMEKESGWLLWGATELRTPFFLQTPKQAHVLKSGRKKRYIFLCTNERFRYVIFNYISTRTCLYTQIQVLQFPYLSRCIRACGEPKVQRRRERCMDRWMVRQTERGKR